MVTSVPKSERFIFSNQFESLWLRALKNDVTSELEAKLQAAGVKLHALQAAYPVAVWEACLAATAQYLYPTLPKTESYYRLGHRMVQGYFDTKWGSHFLTLLRMLGQKRMLMRTQSIFRTSNNFSFVTVTELAPKHFELWIDDYDDEIFFTRGVLAAGLEASGVKNPNVAIVKVDPAGVTFDIVL
jgi:uncharacterized protein (TIGR02265 family)